MATKKISELEAINAAEDNDVLVIVDTSESTTNKITKGNLLIGAGHTIEMTLNENYQIVLVLKNAAGTALSTQTIDLPNENAVTNLAYNNGILTVTKQSGATSQINLTGLIEGLVTESDFNTFKEALQATLEAINEKDAEQDEAIAENYKVINKLNEKLENQQKVIDQLPQVEGQGTEITLENTIEAPFTIFDVEGNSTQETTEGKNKLSLDNFTTQTSNGITATKNSDGTITLNGTATDSTVFFLRQDFLTNTGDKLSGCFGGSSTTYKLDFWVLNQLFPCYNGEEVALPDNTTGNIRIVVYNGTTINNVKIKPMISTNGGDFEPFTNGASPNPNYEQPILSAGDNENYLKEEWEQGAYSGSNGVGKIDSNQYVRSKEFSTIEPNKEYTSKCVVNGVEHTQGNIFFYKEDESFISSITNISSTFTTPENAKKVKYNIFKSSGITPEDVDYAKLEKGNKATPYSPYGMGSINEKISNKNLVKSINVDSRTSQYITTLFIDCDLKANTTYTISFIGTSGNKLYANEKIFNSSGNFTVTSGRTSVTLTTKANLPQDQYSDGKGWNIFKNQIVQTAANIFTDVQIEPGSTESSYVPHEEQDYSIPVQAPFRSNKDKTIRDCFVKKSDGWYERHYIGRKILNGTELVEGGNADGGTEGVSKRFYITHNLTNLIPANTPDKLMCSNFVIGSTYGNDNTLLQLSATLIYIRININEYSNLQNKEQVKAWLAEQYASGNPVYVDYILENPTDLPCTQSQIDVLENLPSTYKDFTIIQSEDETEAYLEVSGIRDIDTMFDKVTNAIVSLGGNV